MVFLCQSQAMKFIICGSNRPNSNSLKVSKHMQKVFQQAGEDFEIIELAKVLNPSLMDGSYEAKNELKNLVDQISMSDGLLMVVPEYNGSYPGILKLFIDHWKYPETFEHKPVAFIGLGGRFGGMRPVEHLQQVFGYRNAFAFPERVFLQNVWNLFENDHLKDAAMVELLKRQGSGFLKFISALKSQGLVK
jgi:chromate reductase